MALKLIDAVIRHQIYLEGLKAGQLRTFQVASKSIEQDVRVRLLGMSYSTMDGMTKAQLRKLLSDLRTTLNRHYSKYVESLIEFLRKFMATDTEILKAMYSVFTPDDEEVEIPEEDKRWAALVNFPMPANGAMLLTWIRGLVTQGTGTILLRVNQAYANREKLSDVVAAIVGTDEANFRDGVLGRTSNSARAVINTALQHVAANNQAEIAKLIWPRYRWVSVLDNRTTNICRSRDGNIYIYGRGPLPPAHPGCRSTTLPIAPGQDVEDMPTLSEWGRSQPSSVLRGMFGTDRAPAHFDAPIPLTLEGYAATRASILQD